MVSKAGEDELALLCVELFEEWVGDITFVEESCIPAKIARLLGEGAGRDSVVCGSDSSVDTIQEVSSSWSGWICKVDVVCSLGHERRRFK